MIVLYNFLDIKVETALYGIIHSTTGKYRSVAFNEWSHHRNLSTDSKVTITLHGTINSTAAKFD